MFKNQPSDIKLSSDKFNGFFRGVVESTDDPLKMGRVQVRIFGLHTDRKNIGEFEGIPTADLPWAEPVLGITEGSITGYGFWSVPVNGSHVMVFFENGNYIQPRYFGTIPGIPTVAPNTNEGFNDPDGNYPRSDRLNESDYHRLARGVSEGTIIEYKNDNREKGISTALGGSWEEPASTFAAQYPNNIVLATHGGLSIEIDSSPGSKRFHVFHPSNTYIEVDNDGNVVIKNNKTKYEIIVEDHNIYVKRNKNITIDGNVKNLIKGNEEKEVDGNVTETVGGNVTETVGGNVTETVGGGLTINVTGSTNLTCPSVTVTSATIRMGVDPVTSGKKLLNETGADLYNTHTHNHGDAAGTTSIPNQQMEAGHETSNTRAT